MEEIQNEQNIEKALLTPDHPLLEKFQQALKEHLLLQINRLKDDIFEIESETKQKSEEKEKLGVQTYEAQQMVCMQQKTLENVVNQIQNVTAAKEEMEASLEESKKKHKEVQEKYLQTEKANREIQTEIESIEYLNNQMIQWEKKTESHISVNKRIVSKTRKDYNQLFHEKRQQDMLIYNLTTAVWKLENEIETLTQENKMKENEVDELEQGIAVANTNIEAFQSEIRCLMHSWNSVVVAISNRDKGLECLNEEHRKLKENLKSIISEIEQVKKLTKKELNENERLTMVKTRLMAEIKNCDDQTKDNLFCKDMIDKELLELTGVLEQIEQDIQSCKMENEKKESTIKIIIKDFNKVVSRKQEVEEKLVQDLENLLSNDKVANNLTKLLNKSKMQRRDVEILMHEAENRSSLLSSEIEGQKFKNSELTRLFEETQKQQNKLNTESDYLQAENEKYETLFKKRERQIDSLVTKYEKEAEKNVTTTSPKEMVILELEKNIEDTQEIIQKLQSFWLREQKNMLSVSKERQDQIQNLNILKQQTKILEQKNLNVNDELEVYKTNQNKVIHNINNLQNKSVILCEAIFKKRNQKDKLDRTNILIQSEYETKLRDAELIVLQIEADISDIEEQKVTLSKELININREALEWDKKLQLTRETVNHLKRQKDKSGELGCMKLEIHKMELIYGQMKKAQEKLVKDLLYCISRRDQIYYDSEAKSKKQATHKQKIEDNTRIAIVRKINDMRKKIKQAQDEIAEIQENLKQMDGQERDLKNTIKEKEIETKVLQEYSVDMAKDLEEAKSNRQLHFERLLIQQKKISMYNDLLLGRKPFRIFKTEDQLVNEYNKQKKLNGDLTIISETLMFEFSEYSYEFQRLVNSLQLARLILFY